MVAIGGGTGTYTVLSGLKKYPREEIDLSAVISVADSGGSTGRLRDEFGYLPVGDLRMALSALASTSEYNDGLEHLEGENANLLRSLFLHRFDKGDVAGHNVGNLLLVALIDMLGTEERALSAASQILRLRGKVVPITTSSVDLKAEYEDGTVIKGESDIDEPPAPHDGTQPIINLSVGLEDTEISEGAKKEIENADLIILGPGDLYTSLLPNFVVKGAPEALQNTNANILYIVNLMSKYGQTYGFNASRHLEETKKYMGFGPNFVLFNDAPLPEDILEEYRKEEGYPVENDFTDTTGVIETDLLAEDRVEQASGDVIKRSLIRHDPDKLATEIMKLI